MNKVTQGIGESPVAHRNLTISQLTEKVAGDSAYHPERVRSDEFALGGNFKAGLQLNR